MRHWGKIWILLLPVVSLLGQVDADKGSISGLVQDSAEAPIENAAVVAVNATTGARREARTNPRGFYRLGAMDAGRYDVQVEASALAASLKDVGVNVGAWVQVDFKLSLAATAEKVDLSTSFVAVTDATASQIFPLAVIRDLPIDGRRFQDFAVLAPTVQANAETRNQLSFLGQRGAYSNVMIDGADYNEPFLGGIRGGDRAIFAFTVPQSAIEEFQVIANGYSTEYGRSTGGILNAITRSGTNALHGEAFYNIRDNGLGLKNPFGAAPLGRQQQSGASVGGPVVKRRLFWFAALEGQLASYPRQVRFPALDTVAGSLTPAITPAYNYFRSLEGPYTQTNNAVAGLARIDYQFANGSRLTGRFNGSWNQAVNGIATGSSWAQQTNDALSNNGTYLDSTRTVTVQYTSILSASLINDLRFEYSAESPVNRANSAQPLVQAGVIGSFGTGSGLPLTANDSRLQFADSLTIQRGLHSFVAGVDYNLIRATQQDGMNQYGSFLLASSDVPGILGALSATGDGSNRFDNSSVVYWRQVGSASIHARAQEPGLFLQDSWRVSPGFTVNYGVRWEAQLNPSPLTGNSFLVDNTRDFTFPLGRIDPTQIRSQSAEWAPRAGIAWNVSGLGQTVVRAGAGLFYGQTPLAFYGTALNDFGPAGGDLSLQIAPNSMGTVYQQFARAGFNLNQTQLGQLPVLTVPDVWMGIAGEPNQFAQSSVFTTSGNSFRNPRSSQISASIEHRFRKNLVVSYQFNDLNTVHLPRVVDFNVPQPFVQSGDLSSRPFFGLRSGTPRPNPNLGAIYVLDSSARSTFIGNTIRATYRAKRLEFTMHYTLSFNKSNDDLQWPFTTTSYQNPFDFSREWGWSSMDARHQAAGYLLFHGPKGIEFTALFDARSGLPIDATTGADTSELLATSLGNRPLQAPGVPFARNAFRNLGYRSVDFRVLKSFTLREAAKIELSAEAFNAFNFTNVAFTPNFIYPDNPAFIDGLGVLPNGSPASVNPGFLQQRIGGAYNAATMYQEGSPLQAQLGVRLFF